MNKLALRVDFLRKFQGIAVSQVSVGRRDGKDEAGFTANELEDHALDLLFDIHGLVPDRHLRETRQINQGQVEHCGRNKTL